MKIKSIRQIGNLEDKTVLLRVDFNVPLSNKRVLDDFKIINSLDTIEFLLNKGAKILILTHFGRPKGVDKKYSVKPIAKHLSTVLNRRKKKKSKVSFINQTIGKKVQKKIDKMKQGEILFLENIRFFKEEKKNDLKFAKELAGLADVYINEAFANSHRAHASMDAVKKYLKPYAGILLEKEVRILSGIKKKDLVVILGGVKAVTKIPLIERFYGSDSKILVGGALANNFLLARNKEIGRSFIDKDGTKLVKNLKKMNIITPKDVIVSNSLDHKSGVRVCNVGDVKKRDAILDIGPETIKIYAKHIKSAQTLIWNGPVGMFENKRFRTGTLAVARLVASRSKGKAFGIVGGGETIEALKMSKMEEYVDFISSGGGAMLSYLGNEEMPGLKGIIVK